MLFFDRDVAALDTLARQARQPEATSNRLAKATSNTLTTASYQVWSLPLVNPGRQLKQSISLKACGFA